MTKTIPILDLRPAGYYDASGREPIYRFHHSYPHVTTLSPVRVTAEEAYADAEEWARGFRDTDPIGNFAHALGVAQRHNGYVGVVNYYHSNT